jgi:hypothetical protein
VRLYCYFCGKSVSNEVPRDTVVRALLECPECIEKKFAPATVAQRFHETYERLAPSFGYQTREASAKPWADVPEQNKALMIAVCAEICEGFARPVSNSDDELDTPRSAPV